MRISCQEESMQGKRDLSATAVTSKLRESDSSILAKDIRNIHEDLTLFILEIHLDPQLRTTPIFFCKFCLDPHRNTDHAKIRAPLVGRVWSIGNSFGTQGHGERAKETGEKIVLVCSR